MKKRNLFGWSPLIMSVAVAMAIVMPSAASPDMFAKDRKTRKTVDAAATTLNDSTRKNITRNDRRRYDYFFLEAVRQQNAGHLDGAFDLLSHCIDINPNAAEAYYMRSAYFSEMDNDSLALVDLEKAATLDPGNDTYQERVAQYYIGTQNYNRAITAYENLYSHHRDRSDVLAILLQLYRQNKDYDKMLSTIDRMEQADGESDNTTMARMNVYEMKGDKKMAQKTLHSLVDRHPNEPMYKVMLGNWLLQNHKQKEAYEMLTAALKDDPGNESALSSMYDYYRAEGKDSLAVELRDKLLLSPKTENKTKNMMLQQAIQENEKAGGDSTQTLALFDRVMRANPKNIDIASLKAAYMQLKKMPDDSVKAALGHILDIAPDNAPARMQLIQMLWPQKKWDDIIALCKSAVQYNPEEMAFYYFLGLAYYNKNDEDAALDAFRQGTGEINSESNPDIVSDFYGIMGDILYKRNRPEEAFAAYDSCLQWKDDNTAALNNYAYYLSELGRNLDKAEQMSYKAIKAEPDNSTYLDTYAWILFLRGRYQDARTYIDMALEHDTDSVGSSVVIEHAGDIYSMNGETAKAIDFWKKALPESEHKALITKKIRLKKYVKK